MQGQLIVEIFQDRELLIYLPPTYALNQASQAKFPVVYIHDHGDLFDPALNDCLTVLEQKFAANQLQELILVGIAPYERNDEYTPWPAAPLVPQFEAFGGQGNVYLAWLVNELKPYIENKYRADNKPENNGIMGKSLGGLISMYAAYRYPAVFGRIGCMSGSFWYENIVEFMEQHTINTANRRIYLDIGSLEGLDKPTRQKEMQTLTHRAYARLVASGFSGDQLKFVIEENGLHFQPFFFKRFPGVLEWLFPCK